MDHLVAQLQSNLMITNTDTINYQVYFMLIIMQIIMLYFNEAYCYNEILEKVLSYLVSVIANEIFVCGCLKICFWF